MWPWLLILAGTLLIVGGLVARHRMMRDFHAQVERPSTEPEPEPEAEPEPEVEPRRATPTTDMLIRVVPASDWPDLSEPTPPPPVVTEPVRPPRPAFARAARRPTEPTEPTAPGEPTNPADTATP